MIVETSIQALLGGFMTRFIRTTIVALVALLLGIAPSYFDLGFAQSSPFTGKYIMAFHGCDLSASHQCFGPEFNDVYLAQSNNGTTWEPIPGIEPFTGDVPDPIRRGNSIFVYYLTFGFSDPPETLNVRRYNASTGALEDEAIVTIEDASGQSEHIVDPSMIVDEDGRLVMFYLLQDVGLNDPALCRPGQSRCVKIYRSATEVEGSNGTEFTVDEGNRFEITITTQQMSADPDIFKGPNGYLMYVGFVDETIRTGLPDMTLALASIELRGEYQFVSGLRDGVLAIGLSGGPSGLYDPSSGQYLTYGTQVAPPPNDEFLIGGAVHRNVNVQIPESQLRSMITGRNFPGLTPSFIIASPGVAFRSE